VPGAGCAPRQVLHALNEPVECVTYDRWQCHLPEGRFTCVADAEQYRAAISRMGGPGAERDWRALEREMQPLAEAAGRTAMQKWRIVISDS
jgi:hypothetical protein